MIYAKMDITMLSAVIMIINITILDGVAVGENHQHSLVKHLKYKRDIEDNERDLKDVNAILTDIENVLNVHKRSRRQAVGSTEQRLANIEDQIRQLRTSTVGATGPRGPRGRDLGSRSPLVTYMLARIGDLDIKLANEKRRNGETKRLLDSLSTELRNHENFMKSQLDSGLLRGATGATGRQGSAGMIGPRGLTGRTGVPGERGYEGRTGATGQTGPQGRRGAAGPGRK